MLRLSLDAIEASHVAHHDCPIDTERCGIGSMDLDSGMMVPQTQREESKLVLDSGDVLLTECRDTVAVVWR